MLKNLINHICVGLAIGFMATTACMWVFGAYEADGMMVMRQFTVWLGASVLYGIISLIYDSSLPLPAAIPAHFAACLAVTYVGSIASGIMSVIGVSQWFVYVLPTFLAIYFIIGITSVVAARLRAKKINEKINGAE